MIPKTKKLTDEAMMNNNFTYIDYFDRLHLLAVSLFKWEGLDDVAGFGASSFLEEALFNYGRACFIKDEELGFLVLNANPSDKLNVYYLPESVDAWSLGYNKKYALDEIVYIRNNILEIPTVNSVNLFAKRLYDVQRTMDVNLTAQKTPVLIETDAKSLLTLQNLYMQYNGNLPFIFGDKSKDLGGKLNVLKTDAPYIIDKLYSYKLQLFNECLTYLGIDNANTDKKERLITDEVESNNEVINYYLNTFYKTRKQACDDINKKYNLNIKLMIDNDLVKKLKDDFDINLDIDEEDENFESSDENE